MIIGIDAINLRSDGGKTHLLEILRNIKLSIKNENKIIVFCNHDNTFFLNDIDFINLITIPKYLNYWLIAAFWQNLFLSKLAKSYNCDVLFNLNGTYIGKFKNYLTIQQNLLPFSFKDNIKYKFSYKFFKFFLLKYIHLKCIKNAKGVIFLSNYQKKLILSYSKKIFFYKVIPHAAKRFYFNNRQKKIEEFTDNNTFKIGYISSLEPYKNHESIIELLSEIKKKGYPISLYIIGKDTDRRYKKKIVKIIKNYNKNWITLYNNIEYSKIEKLYSKLDLTIFGSQCESFGIPLAESIKNNIPCLCAESESSKNLFENSLIFFNIKNNAESINIIENTILSLNLRKTFASNDNEFFYKRTWQDVSNETFEFINNLKF